MTKTIKKTVCTYCSMQCGVGFAVEGNNVLQIVYDLEHSVNRGSLCPRGHYVFDLLTHPDRLATPRLSLGKESVPATWEGATKNLAAALEKVGGTEAGLIINGNASLQDLFAAAKFCSTVLKTPYFEIADVAPSPEVPAANLTNFTEILDMDTLVIWGDVLTKAPCFAKYIDAVKYAKKGNQIVVIDSRESRTSWFANKFIRVSPGSPDSLKTALAEAEKILANATRGAVIISSSVDDPVLEAAGKALAAQTNKKYLAFHYAANTLGARSLLNAFKTAEVKGALREGKLKVLLLFGVSLSPDLMEAAHQLDFFMAADVFETETTKTANLVLPLAAPTEVAGTYISCSQIINHLQPVVQPYGQAKTSWQILSTLTAEDLTLRIIEKLLATPCPLTYSGSLAGLAAGREENILHALDQAHTKKFGWAKVNGA